MLMHACFCVPMMARTINNNYEIFLNSPMQIFWMFTGIVKYDFAYPLRDLRVEVMNVCKGCVWILWCCSWSHVHFSFSLICVLCCSLFERALETCGLEFRSDKLWDKYIDWEAKNEKYVNITQIYRRLMTTPTKCYSTHFDKYVNCEHIQLTHGTISLNKSRQLWQV